MLNACRIWFTIVSLAVQGNNAESCGLGTLIHGNTILVSIISATNIFLQNSPTCGLWEIIVAFALFDSETMANALLSLARKNAGSPQRPPSTSCSCPNFVETSHGISGVNNDGMDIKYLKQIQRGALDVIRFVLDRLGPGARFDMIKTMMIGNRQLNSRSREELQLLLRSRVIRYFSKFETTSSTIAATFIPLRCFEDVQTVARDSMDSNVNSEGEREDASNRSVAQHYLRDHGELFLLLRAIWTICLAHSPAGNLQGCQPQPIREDNGIVNCKNTLEQHVQLCVHLITGACCGNIRDKASRNTP